MMMERRALGKNGGPSRLSGHSCHEGPSTSLRRRTGAFVRSRYRGIGIDGIPRLMPGPHHAGHAHGLQPCDSSPSARCGDMRCSLGTSESR
jgi:hypothetical protein